MDKDKKSSILEKVTKTRGELLEAKTRIKVQIGEMTKNERENWEYSVVKASDEGLSIAAIARASGLTGRVAIYEVLEKAKGEDK